MHFYRTFDAAKKVKLKQAIFWGQRDVAEDFCLENYFLDEFQS